ncbi:fungal-specific transcription factor domain-containing protein [Aspergillus unguis]
MSAERLYQPFECTICHGRFTRHENLKRHALLHTRAQNEGPLACEICPATFSRSDLRNRHMKRKHPEEARRKRCRSTQEESPGVSEQHEMDADAWTVPEWNEPQVTEIEPVQSLEDSLSPLQVRTGCDLFFTHVAHFLPFIHQPTFDADQAPPYLLLSMLSLAFQYGDQNLSKHCFDRARTLLDSTPNQDTLSIVQSYLLLQVCGMLYLCGSSSSHALRMHSTTISLARQGSLMQPIPVSPSSTQDLSTLWRSFITSESHKRTLFALHQIDALWYQFLSIPRSISHLEIKHDLPCPTEYWTAVSPADWAHRQLITKSTPNVKYADAVRKFLSQDPGELSSLPEFDPYGAINITQFLISSAREISGWSTMTGMLSIERFGALRESLATIGPFICLSQDDASNTATATATATKTSQALCTATWQTAMIELQIWSPSHTSGIVEGSIDAVLSASTHPFLAPCPEILCEEMTAKALQPHVDWFLRYLDETINPEGEAPWIALYAYKAFLIAWQLVRAGVPAMAVVGIDGDIHSAVRWARIVFRRRERWVLGRLICACLDTLLA